MNTAIAPVPRAKIERFTKRAGAAGATPETIVLALPGDRIEDAFALARESLAHGQVRLIGPGVTLESIWPGWVRDTAGLTLTELGALQHASLAEVTTDVQAQMRGWIRERASGLFGTAEVDRILFAGVCLRFFQRVIAVISVARGLQVAFPMSEVRLVREEAWIRSLVSTRTRSSGVLTHVVWATRFSIAALGTLAAALWREVGRYRAASPTFRLLAELKRNARPTPRRWLGLVPDWYRINHHLLDALALPLSETEPLGVILVSTLASGLRDETDMRRHRHTAHPWPGLGRLGERLDRCVVEQAVVPQGPFAFARSLVDGAVRALRLAVRLSRSPRLVLPALDIPMRSWTRELAAWATIDVVRATLAEHAARGIVGGRRHMSGATVGFVAANTPSVAAADLAFQHVGAITFDSAHGFLADSWSGSGSPASAIRFVWTDVEGRPPALPTQRTITAGMPIRIRLGGRASAPTNILIMSNYAHPDSIIRGRHVEEMYQDELLRMVTVLRANGHGDKAFRWRPHPADDENLVRSALARHADLELSRGTGLEADARWADVIISTVSSTVIEVLFAGVPVFVHALPAYWGTRLLSFVDPDRLFFYADDGARLVADWLRRFQDDVDVRLAPELRARRVLFGPRAEPTSLIEIVADIEHSRAL